MINSVPAMKLIDISPLLSSELAVFPGDTPLSQKTICDFKLGHSLALSSLHATVHLGAHADAPSHYRAGASDIAARSLDLYFGRAQVITVQASQGKALLPSDLGPSKILAPRILFKTNSYPDPDRWNQDFNSLSPEMIDFLHQRKVILVGIDTPSVDLSDEKILKTHHQISKYDMAILEGLDLKSVEDGLYTLCAFPLKLKNFEASPVRAVLISGLEVPL